MAVVDFQQDPNEAFGTGNFRDDKGRVMYLHDPDTASTFIKTMPGATLGKKIAREADEIIDERTNPNRALSSLVGNEANQIATSRLGAPQRGPDLRLASAGAAPMTDNAADSAGAALVASAGPVIAGLDAPAAAPAPAETPPGTPPAAPSIPAAAPAAPVVAPGAPAPAGAPGGAPAAPAATPLAALAQASQGVSAFDQSVAERSKQRDVPQPKVNPPGGLPLHGTRSGEGVTVDEGRPVENAIEQAREEGADFDANAARLRAEGKEKDVRDQAEYERQKKGALGAYMGEFRGGIRHLDAQRAAERQHAKLQEEIKKNDAAYDPDRVLKNMSTGKRIGMIILAALNGGFGALIGQKENGVLAALQAEIDRDIDMQKTNIGKRGASLNNDLKKYLDMGFDEKTAAELATGKAISAITAYKDLEAKRLGAVGQHAREAEAAIAPLRTEYLKRKGDILKESEDRVKRSREESITHEVPAPALMSPQDVLALLEINNRKIANANTADIEAAVGHPVTPDEASQYRKDAQEYTKRLAVIASTRAQINAVANKVGLFNGPKGYEGTPDPGKRPLGTSAFDEHARDVDREYSLLKRADIMQMVREPSAPLQTEFGQITARPFNDTDIAPQLNTLNRVLNDAESELRAGFSDEAFAIYEQSKKRRAAREAGSTTPAPAAAAPPPRAAGSTPAARAAAEAERKKTLEMMDENKPAGNLDSY